MAEVQPLNHSADRDSYDIIIIGGGASGMTAAISASRFFAQKNGKARIALIERHAKLGRKVAATGNGRCNLSNIDATQHKSIHYHSEFPPLFETVLDRFDPKQAIRFFESMGIWCTTTAEEKIYPFCEQASTVVHAFSQELSICHVEILLDHDVQNIRVENPEGTFTVTGLWHDPAFSDGETGHTKPFCLFSRRLVAATGGKASPALSSDGSGYGLLHSLSHSCTLLFPAIVQLKTETDFIASLAGIKWNVGISLMHITRKNDEKSKTPGGASVREIIRKESGELLFTKYGISGPPVLQLARHLAACSGPENGEACYAVINFLETYSTRELIGLLSDRIREFGSRPIRDFLVGIIPYKIAGALVKKVFPQKENRPVSSISEQELAILVTQLQMFPLKICGTAGWTEAQVTAGGIRCDELNPETLESNLCKGLYIAGEVLDVDGDCGGYNLQFAWASGWIAGENAAKSLLPENPSDIILTEGGLRS